MKSVNNRPRVVIDTNLILSTLVFAQGRLTPLRIAWQDKRIQPLLSKDATAELIRVLAYPKFMLRAEDQQELLDDYLPYCLSLGIPNPPPVKPGCRDAFICSILTADQFLKTLNP